MPRKSTIIASGARPSAAAKIARVLVVLAILVVAGGLGFLAMWDIPAPGGEVEKVLPDDRFPS